LPAPGTTVILLSIDPDMFPARNAEKVHNKSDNIYSAQTSGRLTIALEANQSGASRFCAAGELHQWASDSGMTSGDIPGSHVLSSNRNVYCLRTGRRRLSGTRTTDHTNGNIRFTGIDRRSQNFWSISQQTGL
jgi:hypothetical protein